MIKRVIDGKTYNTDTANPKPAKKEAKADKSIAKAAAATEAAKKDWLTPAQIKPRRRLSETATAARKRHRRRSEALSDAQRADLVRELREQSLNAEQIEAEIAKRQGQEAG